MKSTSTSIPVSSITTATMSTLSDDVIITRIKSATEGLPSNCFNHLSNRVLPSSRQNALIICDYISSLMSEINPSDHYRRDTIFLLCSLSTFFKNTKHFKEITRDDLLSFLGSYRKTEDVDPLHKWIGRYNTYRMQLMRFFKWLDFPDIEQKKSAISNAKAFIRLQQEYGSFDSYLWSFVDGKPRHNHCKSFIEVPSRTEISDVLSKAMKKKGFVFVSSTICYSLMQAVGMVNDHIVQCFRYKDLISMKSLTEYLP